MTISEYRIAEIAGYAVEAYTMHGTMKEAAAELMRRCRQHGLPLKPAEAYLLVETIDQYEDKRGSLD